MCTLYGWQYFDKLAKNNPRIGRSGNDPITLLNAGERNARLEPLATTLLSASKGNPLAVQYPTHGTITPKPASTHRASIGPGCTSISGKPR
jgi:iron(III) transport system substrate-binding protein